MSRDSSIPDSVRSLAAYLRDIGWEEVARIDRGSDDASKSEGAPQPAAENVVSTPNARSRERGAAQLPDTRGESASSATAAPSTAELATPDVASCTDLASLEELALGCHACPLAAGRNKVVFGTGAANADLMFVGEGPGAREDEQGEPFVGPAGALLTKIIAAIGLARPEVYIANVVKCRPPNNRDPQPGEVATCIGYLRRQIEFVQPRILVALGRVAAQALLESSAPVGRMRGKWHLFAGVPLRVTYHPAALLRNESLKRPTWEDMKTIRDRLQADSAHGGSVDE